MKRLLLLLLLLPVIVQGQIITTVAGNDTTGYSGDGGMATKSRLAWPTFVRPDIAGNLYIADLYNYRIRKVAIDSIINTIVGDGLSNRSGDGGLAIAAGIAYPTSVAVDRIGNLYIAEQDSFSGNGPSWIRKVSVDDTISSIAGNGTIGYSGDSGQATAAGFQNIIDIAVDGFGNIYLADGNRIRKINNIGIITTIAGNGIAGFTGDNGPATVAELNNPVGIAVDEIGNVYISDNSNDRIRKVDTAGIISTIAGNGIFGFSGDGGSAISAELYRPEGIAVDRLGNVYIVDQGNLRIRKIDTSGIINTIAGGGSADLGDGGPPTSAEFIGPYGVSIDSVGNIYVADPGAYNVRKISPISTEVITVCSPTYITLYPNPATIQLTISSSENITSISITNLLGQTVYSSKYSGSLQKSVDVAELPSGVYIIKINGAEIRKFLKE